MHSVATRVTKHSEALSVSSQKKSLKTALVSKMKLDLARARAKEDAEAARVAHEYKQRMELVDRRQFCRCIIGVSGVPRGPYCMCKTKMVACALRIKCCVLESCCSFDGSFPSRSTNVGALKRKQHWLSLNGKLKWIT